MQHTLGHWNLWKCEWNYEPQLVQVSRKRQFRLDYRPPLQWTLQELLFDYKAVSSRVVFQGTGRSAGNLQQLIHWGRDQWHNLQPTCGSWVQYSVDRVLGRTTEIAAPGIWHRGDWPVQRNSPTRAGLGRARRIWRSAVLVEKMQTRFWVALWFLSGHTESVVRRLTPMLRPADRGRNQRSD